MAVGFIVIVDKLAVVAAGFAVVVFFGIFNNTCLLLNLFIPV